jgi:hypothetical protein
MRGNWLEICLLAIIPLGALSPLAYILLYAMFGEPSETPSMREQRESVMIAERARAEARMGDWWELKQREQIRLDSRARTDLGIPFRLPWEIRRIGAMWAVVNMETGVVESEHVDQDGAIADLRARNLGYYLDGR